MKKGETTVNTSEHMIHSLEARAQIMTEHMADIDFLVAHKDLFRALMLVQALNGLQQAVEAVKDALRHGENAALVRLLSTKDDPELTPGSYAAWLSLYTLMELDRPNRTFPEEDLWAMWLLIGQHYEPVPYAPYSREQLLQAMQEDQ